MKIVKLISVVGIVSTLSGCYMIGIETIAPRKEATTGSRFGDRAVYSSQKYEEVRLYDLTIKSWGYTKPSGRENDNSRWENQQPDDKGRILANTGTRVRNRADIKEILGEPNVTKPQSIIYDTNKRSWRGIVVDAAIFPIPLTIPLMLPGTKNGYIEFLFDQDGKISSIYEHGPTSKFYGFWGADSGYGFSEGTEPGFWFHEE